MDSIRVWLLGELRIEIDGRLVPAFATHKAKSLFANLLFHRHRALSRDALIAAYWREHAGSEARKLLRNEIWRIRSAVDPRLRKIGSCLVTQTDTIAFNSDLDVWVDVEAFNDLANSTDGATVPTSDDEEAGVRLCRAVDLYKGSLLEGCYDDWCVFERDALEDRYLGVLQRLLRSHADSARWEQAIACGKRMLSVDPLREDVHRDLMRCYYLGGNRPAALRQFDTCRRALRDELGVEPMPETVALAQALKEGSSLDGDIARGDRIGGDTRVTNGRAEVERMLVALQIARRGIREMDRLLSQAIKGVERIDSGLSH